ncbi:Uncharacterized protein SCF082_LOCUS52831 [Durusdinium trenchii]|uniref:Uncharacterized protein n=1 Tax=Durusdinium trenchii TaxID=1381693 RepID=A0ABP0SNR3_9DINO
MENKHKLVHFNSLTLAHPVIVNLQAAMGALTIDEAVTLCQSVCSGNPSTLAWIMLPQYYTSSSKHSVLKNRRLLEDKLLGCMDVYEVSLNYADAQHSGDKRKKSQQCIAALCGHTTNAAFSKSKALLGSIEGIERTRVTDLQNPDPEHSLAPHWRVQQRGIPACQAIIEQLLQGMGASHGSPLLICDLLPSRFGEWSQAAWEMQLEFLRGSSAWDVRFAACYHTDHAADLNSAKELITGKAMHSWWDKSPEAGSKSRAAVPFSEPLPELECLTLNDGEVKIPDLVQQNFANICSEGLKKAMDSLVADTKLNQLLKAHSSSTPGATTATGDSGSERAALWQVRTGKEKKLQSIAEVLCGLAKTRGVTEVRMTDHSL